MDFSLENLVGIQRKPGEKAFLLDFVGDKPFLVEWEQFPAFEGYRLALVSLRVLSHRHFFWTQSIDCIWFRSGSPDELSYQSSQICNTYEIHDQMRYNGF